ncbi:MAG TPA: 2,3-epoxybenzoyl-CoA dihydrolase [Candidatus Polarisedimenticolaceae bacterium]|nr:2,3-epoxybenzoyl-CoA dihydrolase [Candidatus Polarisedimenticolaceae bacterium]
MDTTTSVEPITFGRTPESYLHWKLSIDGPVATLVMAVQEDRPLRPGYRLKLNSYDLGVDLELHDAVQRLRFEHPEVRCVVITGALDRVFCAGANINMLASSTHAFKVNFCKFTNETRLAIEDASALSGQRYLAALNGVCAGGGYELALACDEILLVDDGNSAVSLPEVPLLGVLPGTGGLTRIVDKRKVRRDLADVFCTIAEGVKGKRAVTWNLVDEVATKSRFSEAIARRASRLVASSPPRETKGVALPPLSRTREGDTLRWTHVTLAIDRGKRTATLTVRGPAKGLPESPSGIRAQGAAWWPLAAFRELDEALLELRHNEEEIGLVLLKTEGDVEAALTVDRVLASRADDWFVAEVRAMIARTLRRLDLTARSLYALIEPGSCFAGTLFELALAADRSYMLYDKDRPVSVAISPMNAGAYPMTHGPARLAVRFFGDPETAARLAAEPRVYDPTDAEEAGLVTVVADEIDYEDEVRVAVEERASLSPDALTGMEASLRFPGPETGDSKIFARLSAWQNWIFQRPNAVGERGALTLYGKPERPLFDFRRT